MKNLRLLPLIATLVVSVTIAQNFITRNGNKLNMGNGGPEIYLRGISFGNLVWADVEVPSNHHSEIDYKRLQGMGMNVVRFYLNYKTFENDATPYQYKQTGWDWLDLNIAWAKKYGIYLILNIHVPQGGFQSQCKGDALWTNIENQNRVVNLWKAIANKYKNEPQIAGFDLVNEPTPSVSVSRWHNLAQRLVDSIRTVDKNHLIIAERAIALGCDYGYDDGNLNYPILKETNLMYTVHFYEPYLYTHQNQAWAGTGDGGKYPDESAITPPSDLSFATGQYGNSSITGTKDWTFSKGKPFLINHDSLIIGRPTFYGHRLGNGKAYYDDITVNEVDANGNVLKEILKVNFNSKGSFYFWSEKGDGAMKDTTIGHNDSFSFSMTGTSGFGTINAADFPFKLEKGKYYAINGWIKTVNVPANAVVSITTEFSYSPTRAKVYSRNKNFLRESVLRYSAYPRNNGFPVYFGEFGLSRSCYANGKGGEQWTADLMQIFDSLGYHFTYHTYHEDGFGLYAGWNEPIDSSTVIQSLKNTFTTLLLNKTTDLPDDLNQAGISFPYPNPFLDYFELENKSTQQICVQLFNVLGQDVEQKYVEAGEKTQLGKYLPKGIYYGNYNIGNNRYGFKILKQ